MLKSTVVLLVVAGMLSACGAMPLAQIAPPLKPSASATSCEVSGAERAFAFGAPAREAVDFEAAALANILDLRVFAARRESIEAALSERVKKEPVYQQLVNELEFSTYETQRSLVERHMLRADLVPNNVGTHPAGSLSESDFRSFAKVIQEEVFSTPFAYASGLDTGNDFKKYFTDYFSVYFSGKFVDRFGVTLPKPVLSRNIGDTEISGTVTVFVELLLDYWLHTPVWKDSAGTLYPGQFGSDGPPTAVKEGLAPELLLQTESKKCGITALKAKAVQYVASTAGTKASSIGGLVGGSFGGLHFGFGILGKVSVGDNKTLSTLVKSVLGKAFERVGEETSYRILYWIRYDETDDLTKLLQKYLDAKNGKTKTDQSHEKS
jgi:hypothetical protein